MSITSPAQLVAEFKKSGEFDRLRRELLTQFKNDESIGSFMARVQEIVQQRLNDDAKLQYMPAEAVHTELMQEMDRYPLVERAIADLPILSDLSFNEGIRKRLNDLVRTKPENRDGCRGTKSDDAREKSDSDEPVSSDEDESDKGEPNKTKQNERPRQTSKDGQHQ